MCYKSEYENCQFTNRLKIYQVSLARIFSKPQYHFSQHLWGNMPKIWTSYTLGGCAVDFKVRHLAGACVGFFKNNKFFAM
jgi:hypothetical protein